MNDESYGGAKWESVPSHFLRLTLTEPEAHESINAQCTTISRFFHILSAQPDIDDMKAGYDCRMSILQKRGSRGASVLAAVAFVAIFGLVTMVVINIPSTSDRRALTAQAAATEPDVPPQPAAAQTKQEQISSECKKGEVHTVKEELNNEKPSGLAVQAGINDIGSKGVSGKTVETITKCWIPDPKNPLIMNRNPETVSNPACKVADKNKCVVQYCPLKGMMEKEGTCFVVSCTQGDLQCLQKRLTSARTGGVQGIADFLNQGGGVQAYNPSTGALSTNIQSQFSPDAYSAVDTQVKLLKKENEILQNDLAFQSCQDSFSGCSNEEVSKLNDTRERLLKEQEGLQKTLSTQMQALERSQGSLTSDITGSIDPITGLPTKRYGSPASTGSVDPVTGLPTDTYRPKTSTGFSGPCPNGQAVNQVTGMCGGGSPPYVAPSPSAPPSSGLGSLFGGSPANRAATNGLFYQLGNMIGNLIKGNGVGGAGSNQQQMTCAKTQDQYQQQQQQYNQQIQQYNYQLQQQQQMQMQQNYGGGYGGAGGGLTPVYGYDQYGSYGIVGYQQSQPYGSAYGSPYGYGNQYTGGNSMMGTYGYGQATPPQQPPQPCYNNREPQQCSFSPQQPSSASCASGTWKPTTSGNGCIGGWQCIPSGSEGTGGTNTPVGTISCEPKIADMGMTIAISYACANSTQSSGSGFNTNGALSGSATTTIQNPPQGTNTVTYTLTCKNQTTTAGAECSVQFGKPGIVFLAEPDTVKAGGTTTLGWITSGMQSCVVSSPDLPSFSAQNSGVKSPNGVASASGLTSNTRFALNCTTVGGANASASTTVTITQ